MARYALNLPTRLKQEAEEWASRQGVSLNQFILWAVADKVGALSQSLDDPAHPGVTYRRGASGQPTPVLRGTAVRVQTAEVASEYGLAEKQVKEAMAFYDAHRAEIDASIQAEGTLEAGRASGEEHVG